MTKEKTNLLIINRLRSKGYDTDNMDFTIVNDFVDIIYKEQLILSGVGSSLPDLAECNQASLDYATKKNNPDFFLIKQTFKDGVNWALNYVTRPK
jgi:hypothetical protein